ncbi:MAG TPA: TonB-dependent receptor, partial [Chitinophagaceae bacterium]
ITIGNQSVYTFQAEPLPRSLRGVVVTAQKPLMKQEDDKTIIEPEALAASSTNSYEVIEKTPGLFVDQDGNIYISSLTPATVQINGRDMKMSAADVATLLKSLPPNAIARIEVVRTPSAKYDASSSGGIVNVVLRKGVKLGLTGSVNAGWQQGTYGNKFAGFTLNNNNGKKSSFINFNYSKRKTFEKTMTDRLFAPDSMLSQNANAKYNSDSWFGSYALVFPVGKKWDLDFSTSANLNLFDNNTDNRNQVKKISTSQTLSDNLNDVNNNGQSWNIRVAVAAKYKLDSLGSEWTNDVFYNYTKNDADQLFLSNYSSPIPFISGGDGNNINDRHFGHYQTDLKLKMKKKFTLEAGGKTTFLRFKSVADYYKGIDPNRQKDPNRTNSFNYDENINSLYVQGSKTLGKDFVVKTGLRMENTNMKGNQLIPFDTSFNIHRTDLFPYVYLSKNLMKIAGYDLRAYLIYRRTISRPVYEQLNPFPRYVDQYLTEIGNPALKPQFTTNYDAHISVDERPILAIGVNDTKDIFTNVIYQADSSQSQAYRTYDNLGKNKEWYLRGLGALPPGGKYFFVLGAQYNHNFYDGLYENKPLSFKRGSWVIFTYHQLKLDRYSQFTMNGFVRFKGQQQFYELGTFGSINISINRQFFNQKLIVTLSANDMFYTQKIDFSIKQGSVDAVGSRVADSRRFGINLRYNFGIRKKEENNMFNMDAPSTN